MKTCSNCGGSGTDSYTLGRSAIRCRHCEGSGVFLAEKHPSYVPGYTDAAAKLREECNRQIQVINTGMGVQTPGFAAINRLLIACDAVFSEYDRRRE